ncbi:NADH dehydrogenase [ubiquinone] 1 beta subcomplex subunit 2, mitochondrial-like [Lineus longissimus]|uniref:NADH dehydrogenase [ubiquinone] 1 beta subcomplex subunit 2, mitochondrial-like n=1 Tax=Lineus longissimus TaxID=88925 RepID=UPI002B4C7E77
MLGLVRQAIRVGARNVRTPQISQVRHGGQWFYRRLGDPPERSRIIMAEGVMAFMWWWVLWHLWTEPEHITGHYEYPDVTKWTDEELGIPPDDED